MSLSFSQSVNETVRTVCDQMRRSGSKSPSTALLRRHAVKHVGSTDRSLIEPVITEAREVIARDAINVALIERLQRLGQ